MKKWQNLTLSMNFLGKVKVNIISLLLAINMMAILPTHTYLGGIQRANYEQMCTELHC